MFSPFSPSFVSISSVISIILLCTLPVNAQVANYQEGVRRYQKGDYAGAYTFLKKSVVEDSSNMESTYYCAMLAQKLGKLAEAKDYYKRLLTNFTGTQGCYYAEVALQKLDPNFLKNFKKTHAIDYSHPFKSTVGAGVAFSGVSTVPPDTDTIMYQPEGRFMIVDAEVHSTRARLAVDVVRRGSLIGRNQLQEMGLIVSPNHDFCSLDVRISNIFRKNHRFNVITQNNNPPVVGKEFFDGMDVEVNRNLCQIYTYALPPPKMELAKLKQGGIVGKDGVVDAFEVPFQSVNGQIIVDIDFGQGRRSKAAIFTKRGMTTFTKRQFESIQPDTITAGDVAESESNLGYGVVTSQQTVALRNVSLGRIHFPKMAAMIVDESNARYPEMKYNETDFPLMSDEIWSGYEYKIDGNRKVIRFFKRKPGT